MARNLSPGNMYETATGQPEVQDAVERFRALSDEERARQPLLYWLLLGSTPAYKMSPVDAEYTEVNLSDIRCGSCRFMYENKVSGAQICSQISTHVVSFGYCKLWKG